MVVDFMIDLITTVFRGKGLEPEMPMDEDMSDEELVELPETVEEMQDWLLEQADHFSNDGYHEEAEIAQHIAVQIGVMDLQIDRSPE
jgi:hypothetical protein